MAWTCPYQGLRRSMLSLVFKELFRYWNDTSELLPYLHISLRSDADSVRQDKIRFILSHAHYKQKNISQQAIKRLGWWMKDDYIQVVGEMGTC